VAGYAIVRYSQAAKEILVKYPGRGLWGGMTTQNKGNVQVRVVGVKEDKWVGAELDGRNNNFRGKWVCAEVWVGNSGNNAPGKWQMSIYAFKYKEQYDRVEESYLRTYTKLNGWDRQCVQIKKAGVPLNYLHVSIKGINPTNYLGVSKIWYQDVL
jgi:hypothetical protein